MEEKDQIQTERYLSGDLPEPDRRAFETRLQQEPNLRKHINWQTHLRNNRARQKKKMALLDMLEEEKKQRHKATVKPIFWKRRIAATIAILVLATTFLFRDALFSADNFLEPVPISMEMGENDPETVATIQNYNQEKYEDVVEALSDEDRSGFSPELLRAQGISQLMTKRFAAAIETFQILKTQHPVYGSESDYYIAYAYFKTENWQASQEAIASIPTRSSFYAKGQQLLEKIKNK